MPHPFLPCRPSRPSTRKPRGRPSAGKRAEELGHTALHNKLNELATEIGRIRRCVAEGSTLEWRTERVALIVQTLIEAGEPSAADLYQQLAVRDNDTIAVEEALRIVDERARKLHNQLGLPT